MVSPLLLRGVSVIDVEAGTVLVDRDVLLENGRISGISATGSAAPADIDVVEAEGRFVVPGFVDMHAHPLGRDDSESALELMGAYGITGFRQMSGSPALLADRAAGRLGLPATGPALLAMPGDLLTPMNAGTADAVRATIKAEHEQGADFVKVVSVSPDVLLAALDEAARIGIPIAGHLPNGIDVREVSRRGMRCIEHLGPGVGITASTADDEKSMLEDARSGARSIKAPPVKLPGMDKMLAKMLLKIVINPVNSNKAADVDLLKRAELTFDDAKAREVAQVFVTNGTWQCPTLIRVRTQELANDPRHTDDPELRYIAPSTISSWQKSTRKYVEQGDEAHAVYRATYALQLRLTKIFEEEGVPLLAGTDSSGAGWVIPGHALHQEFDEMATAGLTPPTILRATTLNPAIFLGTTDTQGTVAAGKQADLVLLGSNPLDSSAALHDIVGVVRGGSYRTPAQLDAVKDGIAAARSVH